MNNTKNWKELQGTEAEWLRNEILWSIFCLMLLTGFGWLFLNPQIIVRLYLG